MLLLQAAPPETLIVRADTAAALLPRSDSLTPIGNLGRDLTEAGRSIAAGEWDSVWSVFFGGLITKAINLIPAILGALLVFAVFYALYRIIGSVLGRILHRSTRVDRGLQVIAMKTYRIAFLTLIGVMVLDQLGFQITTLLAGVGIVGIAVGFAARDTLENFISGITILVDRPFRVGDNIEIEGVYGTVEEITLRSTRIRTLNNQILVMPNVHMVNQKLLNHTMLGVVRVEVDFGIAYREYPQQARDVVLRLTDGDTRVHPDYKPDVVVTKLNDSSVDMQLRLYVMNPKLAVSVRHDYVERIREALRDADIQIPFPHRQLFIEDGQD